jgi:hypothetical protein
VLYALATAPAVPPVGFHDITSGSNVGYRAAAGWDYATGLGSFDIAALAPLLSPLSGSSSGSSGSGSSCARLGERAQALRAWFHAMGGPRAAHCVCALN